MVWQRSSNLATGVLDETLIQEAMETGIGSNGTQETMRKDQHHWNGACIGLVATGIRGFQGLPAGDQAQVLQISVNSRTRIGEQEWAPTATE